MYAGTNWKSFGYTDEEYAETMARLMQDPHFASDRLDGQDRHEAVEATIAGCMLGESDPMDDFVGFDTGFTIEWCGCKLCTAVRAAELTWE